MEQKFKGTPPRLPILFQRDPLFLVTFNTLLRKPLLANDPVHAAFQHYAQNGTAFHVGTGRYVLMPDHVHVFVRIGRDMTLRRWVSGLKQCLGKSLSALGHPPTILPQMRLKCFWQPGFFDHLLRQNESYREKWNYVWQNPVQAGLVTDPADWPYQGEIHRIDHV